MIITFRLRGVHIAARLLSFSSLSLATRSFFRSNTVTRCATMTYSHDQFGTCYTTDYKLYLKKHASIVSPFHDIPLLADKENAIYNMVVEIPKWTNAKMEISTKEKMNPIKQDVKKGKARFVKNSFPYKGYIWNYGAIPQTWEDPNETDEHTGEKGDGDPIDIVDIGYKVSYMGEVKQVKVLGIMALIDEGETDWKVIAIDINDPLASKLNDVEDIRKTMPGLLEATRDWFRTYKMPGGAPPNEFAFSGKVKNRSFANDIIMQTHEQWKKLITKEIENTNNLACENVSVDNSPYKIEVKDANGVTKGLPILTAPAAMPDDVDMVYYLSPEDKLGTGKNGV